MISASHTKRHAVAAAILGTALAVPAQVASIADGNASYDLFSIPDSASADAPRIAFTADPLTAATVAHSFWWYFRLAGDTRESTLHAGPGGTGLASIQTSPDRTILRFDDVDGRGISAVYMVTVLESGVGTGHTLHQLTVRNETGAPLDLDLFAYVDIDQCGSARGDSATGVMGRHVVVDGQCSTAAVEVHGVRATHDIVASWPIVLDLLVDAASVGDLPDTGLPYANGSDYTSALQFTSPTLADGDDFTAIAVLSHGGSFTDCGSAAAGEVFGNPADGTFGAPVLGSAAPPIIGGSGEIFVTNTLPNSAALMLYGAGLLNGTAGVNAFGMDFYIDALGTFAFSTDAAGDFRIPLSLPITNMLCGQHFYMRAVIADPAATTQFGIAATEVLDWTIGQ